MMLEPNKARPEAESGVCVQLAPPERGVAPAFESLVDDIPDRRAELTNATCLQEVVQRSGV